MSEIKDTLHPMLNLTAKSFLFNGKKTVMIDYECISKAENDVTHVVLAFDVSGSMENTINDVKAAAITYKKLIIEKLGKSIKLTLIVFANSAQIVYSDCTDTIAYSSDLDKPDMFDLTVVHLKAGGGTNYEALFDRLNDAFKFVKDVPTWAVIFTDGEPTSGKITSEYQISKKIKCLNEEFSYARIRSIGFGKHYKPTMLQAIGLYEHVPNDENASDIISTIVGVMSVRLQSPIFSTFVHMHDHNEEVIFGAVKGGSMSFQDKRSIAFFQDTLGNSSVTSNTPYFTTKKETVFTHIQELKEAPTEFLIEYLQSVFDKLVTKVLNNRHKEKIQACTDEFNTYYDKIILEYKNNDEFVKKAADIKESFSDRMISMMKMTIDEHRQMVSNSLLSASNNVALQTTSTPLTHLASTSSLGVYHTVSSQIQKTQNTQYTDQVHGPTQPELFGRFT